jgi:hypothetical protein
LQKYISGKYPVQDWKMEQHPQQSEHQSSLAEKKEKKNHKTREE